MSVSWTRDNGSLSPYAIIRRGSLRIDRVVATDAGTYTCRAESQAGNSVASATLTVNCETFSLEIYPALSFERFGFKALVLWGSRAFSL